MTTPNILEIIQPTSPSTFDPAENFVEASKLHRDLIEAEVPEIPELDRSPAIQDATRRARKPYPQRPPIPLPDPARFEGTARLSELLLRRRSPRRFGPSEPLSLDRLGWLCWASATSS